ncbi:MAG: ester cyclase [Chloroflexi bacterium]|nr:ester cyclase [Chloroflexota bacterium]
MSEQNKAIVRRFFEAMDRQKGVPTEFFVPNATAYVTGASGPLSVEEFRQFAGQIYSAFPDMRHDLETLIAEGDRVACRGTAYGTHKATFQGVPPSGKPIHVPFIDEWRVAGDRVVELRVSFDAMGLMQQIGALPKAA